MISPHGDPACICLESPLYGARDCLLGSKTRAVLMSTGATEERKWAEDSVSAPPTQLPVTLFVP